MRMRFRIHFVGLSLLATLAIAATPAAAVSTWQGHWSAATVAQSLTLGIIQDQDLERSPDQAMPLSEVADVLLTMSNVMIGRRNSLDALTEAGLIQPTDFASGTIDGSATVARDQFALFVARAIGQQIMAEFAKINLNPTFSDANQVEPRYRNAVSLMQEQEILVGVPGGEFQPSRAVTRAEAFTVLLRIRVSEKP